MTSQELLQKKCQPCEGIGQAMTPEQYELMLKMVPGWEVFDGNRIEKIYPTKNFVETMAFANRIADLAEAENHHPDLHLYYRKVHVVLSTHALGGLSENDFILAAKIDRARE